MKNQKNTDEDDEMRTQTSPMAPGMRNKHICDFKMR